VLRRAFDGWLEPLPESPADLGVPPSVPAISPSWSSPPLKGLPRHLDETLAAACPIVASYGGRDRSLRGAASRLDAALDEAGVTHDVKEYPAASHAFLNDAETGPWVLRPLLRVAGIGPEPDSAKDAWDRIERFFATHLH